MDMLKSLPLSFKGDLHQVRLINFSVDLAEVQPVLPEGLTPRLINNRVLISMVNVKLRHMHLSGTPKHLGFNYQHIGFRLLVDDSLWGGRGDQGIFFLRSFSDNPVAVEAGNLLTHYRLEHAQIKDLDYVLELRQKDRFLHYAFSDTKPENVNEELKSTIAAIDRAYAMNGSTPQLTRVVRDSWPIEWIDCYHFETNFFETARLEGAFQIHEVIPYHWLAPQTLLTQAHPMKVANG